MFTSIQAFIAEWKIESEATKKVLAALTDESLDQAIGEEYRTLGQLGWHLAVTIHEMLSHTGLTFAAPEGGEEAPKEAAIILEAYSRTSEAMLEAIEEQWTDESLQQKSDMYGEEWENGFTLNIFLKHEIHHRGQMTVLMRQAGLNIPGLYGPTREEWISFGMQPLI